MLYLEKSRQTCVRWLCIGGFALLFAVGNAQFPRPGEFIENLNGRHVSIATFVYPPTVLFDPTKKGNSRYSGTIPKLVKEMSQLSNFTYTFYDMLKDKTHPLQFAPGATIASLNFNESTRPRWQMIFTTFIISPERMRQVDVTIPWFDTGYQLGVRKERSAKYGLYSFLAPFAMSLWLSILGVVAVSSALLFVIEGPRMYSHEGGSTKINPSATAIGKSFYATIAAMLQQLAHKPRSFPGYVVTVGILLFSFIIASSYAANLTVFLIGSNSGGLQDIESLRSGAYSPRKVAVLSFGPTCSYFEENVIRCQRNCPKESPTCAEPHCYRPDGGRPYLTCEFLAECLEMLANKTADAVFMSAPELQYMINSMYCGKLTAVGSIIHPINYAVLLAYNSSLTRPMNEAIAKIRATGTIDEIVRETYGQNQCDAILGQSEDRPVSFSDLSGLFVLVGCLYILAITITFIRKVFLRKRVAQVTQGQTSSNPVQSYIESLTSRANLTQGSCDDNDKKRLLHCLMQDVLCSQDDNLPSPLCNHDGRVALTGVDVQERERPLERIARLASEAFSENRALSSASSDKEREEMESGFQDIGLDQPNRKVSRHGSSLPLE